MPTECGTFRAERGKGKREPYDEPAVTEKGAMFHKILRRALISAEGFIFKMSSPLQNGRMYYAMMLDNLRMTDVACLVVVAGDGHE